MEGNLHRLLGDLNCSFSASSEDDINTFLSKVDRRIRQDGFVPFKEPLQAIKPLNENFSRFPDDYREISCTLAYVGKRLAKVIPLVKDFDELRRIQELAEDL